MPQNNYIGVNGLITQSLEEIYADLVTQFQQIYGTDINLDQNSPDGQWLNILAQEKKDILDLFTQYYNNLDVDRVVGIPQQILYKLNGLTINAYDYSYVYIDITTNQALNLNGIPEEEINNTDATGYTVLDSNGNRWILTTGLNGVNTVSLSAGLNQNLRFRAADLGSVTALPNTITIMETIVAGVVSVNNPANNFQTGATGESDAEFRIRRNRSVTVASQGFVDSIEAQLLNLPNVTQAKVYQNRRSSTVDGIPANTVWVICEGGAEKDIGRIIYNNIPPGIPMKGSKTVTITRPNGLTDTVKYDVGVAETLYIQMNIKLLGAVVDENYVKQELSKLTWDIGESVESANISTDVKDIIGDAGTPYDVEVSLDGVTYSEIVTPTALNGFFTLSTSNISITITTVV